MHFDWTMWIFQTLKEHTDSNPVFLERRIRTHIDYLNRLRLFVAVITHVQIKFRISSQTQGLSDIDILFRWTYLQGEGLSAVPLETSVAMVNQVSTHRICFKKCLWMLGNKNKYINKYNLGNHLLKFGLFELFFKKRNWSSKIWPRD